MTNIEHKKVVDFVNGYKEANKNTIERIRQYDPKLRTWTFVPVKKDENAIKFYQDNVKKTRSQKEKEKRNKTNVAKSAQSGNVKSEMELHVVRLHVDEKMTYKAIADKYGTSQSTVIRAYKKLTNEKASNP